jgi:hypothetical protein
MRQQAEGGMDPKWMPDYVRIVEAFPLTDTQKIVVRPFKRENFDIESNPAMVIYYRERGDKTYKPLTREGFLKLKETFEKNGRLALLQRN